MSETSHTSDDSNAAPSTMIDINSANNDDSSFETLWQHLVCSTIAAPPPRGFYFVITTILRKSSHYIFDDAQADATASSSAANERTDESTHQPSNTEQPSPVEQKPLPITHQKHEKSRILHIKESDVDQLVSRQYTWQYLDKFVEEWECVCIGPWWLTCHSLDSTNWAQQCKIDNIHIFLRRDCEASDEELLTSLLPIVKLFAFYCIPKKKVSVDNHISIIIKALSAFDNLFITVLYLGKTEHLPTECFGWMEQHCFNILEHRKGIQNNIVANPNQTGDGGLSFMRTMTSATSVVRVITMSANPRLDPRALASCVQNATMLNQFLCYDTAGSFTGSWSHLAAAASKNTGLKRITFIGKLSREEMRATIIPLIESSHIANAQCRLSQHPLHPALTKREKRLLSKDILIAINNNVHRVDLELDSGLFPDGFVENQLMAALDRNKHRQYLTSILSDESNAAVQNSLIGKLVCHSKFRNDPTLMFDAVSKTSQVLKHMWDDGRNKRKEIKQSRTVLIMRKKSILFFFCLFLAVVILAMSFSFSPKSSSK